jgi:hypothetical protein
MYMNIRQFFRGRISASSYTLVLSAWVVVCALLIQFACQMVWEEQWQFSRTQKLVGWLNTSIIICYGFLTPGRLRDLNMPRWMSKFTPFLLIAVIMLPLLMLYSGEKWDNEFGESPPPSPWWKKILVFVLLVCAIQWMYEAMMMYLQLSYAWRPID